MTHLAISHDWILTTRGAERVLSEISGLFGKTSIYTLFCNDGSLPDNLDRCDVRTSPLNRLPGVERYYRYLLPFFRPAIKAFRVEDADLLISISHSVAKGIRHRIDIPHVCYCLTPARYIWEPQLYGPSLDGFLRSSFLSLASRGWKEWDLETNRQIDFFVAISRTVQERIERCYGRSSEVIYPCIDLDFHRPLRLPREDFYLVVSALVPQKRIELAVEAFNQNGKTLVVAGAGPQRATLQRAAATNIRFLGWQSDETIRDLYNRAKALVFPGTEDFGLVPVEAQACGCPVIAHHSGGLTETVVSGETGVFFADHDPDSLNDAIGRLESLDWDPHKAVLNATRFSRPEFRRRWKSFLGQIGFELPESRLSD